MKKRILLVLVLVVIISMVSVFAACKPPVENPDKPTTPTTPNPPADGEVTGTDFFAAAARLQNAKIVITIKDVDGTVVYSRDDKGHETSDPALNIKPGKFSGTASGLSYSAQDFVGAKITDDVVGGKHTYQASLASAADFLDIKTGTVTDSKIKMVMTDEPSAITSITLEYVHTIDSIAFNVNIEIRA